VSDPVLILLHRPEGYEDADAEIVAYDAIRPEWKGWEIVADPVAAERIASLLRQRGQEELARMVEGGE
jgi:hypothetical protein